MKRCRGFLSLLLLFALTPSIQGHAQETAPTANTFHNPLLETGPDPWVISYKGHYFFMSTTGRNLTVWKTRDITDLAHAEKKVVWTPPAEGPYSKEVWAPELHRLDDKWYIYFAADAGRNDSHRIYVVENAADDPLDGEWTFKGKIGDATDKWAIDASVFEDGGQRYMVWSGWEGDADGTQRIYLAHMKNPWTIDSQRVELSHPQYPWEEVGDLLNRPAMPHLNVNEGPEILKHAGDIFLVYSASACWTDYYALGLVQTKSGTNLMDPASWKKYDHPFFKQNRDGGVFGPGHNGFFKSPDGKQDWIIYHANAQTGQGCGKFRSPRIQPFTWNADGTPNFGEPVPTAAALQKPSGQ